MVHYIQRRGAWFAALSLSMGACAGSGSSGNVRKVSDEWTRTGEDAGVDAGLSASGSTGADVTVSNDASSASGPRGPDSQVNEPRPLLGSSHGGHVWSKFCQGKSDAAALPVDPRTLVQPGVNDAKAVYFNAYWVDCHEGATGADVLPTTCGEYRTRVARAKDSMEKGRMVFFGGDNTDALLTFKSDDYNNLWQKWGFQKRPADFDELAAARWGTPLGSERNPYPLLGEDPNQTNGGSGQLPVALTQLRDEKGTYTGKIGMNCNWCHSGKVGEESDGAGLGALYGNGNSLVEIGAMFGDYFPDFPIAANKVRGTGDILLYPAIAALDVDHAGHYNGALIAAPSQGTVDYPPWWNMGHRTRRFHDGSFAMDDSRPVMGFFMPIMTQSHMLDIPYGRKWIEQHDQDVNLWVESITAPAYPGPIDTKLAEEGAVLFHTRNLWAESSAPGPEGGNGSCATCHGTYSPRYSHDKFFLAQPELEGIAAYVVPLDVIGTDGARANSLNQGLQDTLSYSWWGYGTNDQKAKCFGVIGKGGYLAPPLHGIWASAPYFHNGSVPNVWEVLKPSVRPEIWRRWSALQPSTWPMGAAGFDTDLKRAYDHKKLGWRYDTLPCGDSGSATDCADEAPESTPAGTLWFTWNISKAPMSWDEIDARKTYNTHRYGQGNKGHDFGDALSDHERMAIIEYLKTL